MKYHYSGRDFTHRMKWGRQTLAPHRAGLEACPRARLSLIRFEM